MKSAMNAEAVIGLVPDELLDSLALETGVDLFVKKLQGKIIFKLFLYAILSGKNVSLRILEAIFNSEKFYHLFNFKNSKHIRHSGIGMRLANIDYHYFEKIFNYLLGSQPVDEMFFSHKKINARKIDSTIVTISSKLLKFSMRNSGKAAVKYSVEINQGIPVDILLFKDSKYSAEDNALPELIRKKSAGHSLNIAIFDRGIQRRETFVALAKAGVYFISRLTKQGYTVVRKLPRKKKATPTLRILSDQIICFENGRETSEQEFRLVIGKNKQTKQLISFLTNVDFLEADEVTELYKSRWEIETFFKFLKQELNFSHLLSRTENGIRVIMYLTMIAAILLTIYKKINQITGWAVTKIKFLDELETNLLNSWHQEISVVFNSSKQLIKANTRAG
jgi:hypothetical protein